jgi:hypothetical protein
MAIPIGFSSPLAIGSTLTFGGSAAEEASADSIVNDATLALHTVLARLMRVASRRL